MPNQESPLQQLNEYLPDGAYESVMNFIIAHKVHLTITRERTTILGNYRNRHSDKNHRISVNGNLNKYSFLITLLHELGHLLAFEKYGNKIPVHGAQWKNEYSKILAVFIAKKIFPADIEEELLQTLNNPAATSCGETSLLRVLRKYDPRKPGISLLEELPDKSFFRLKNGRVFRKENKIRTRYLCKDLTTNKLFFFSPLAEVERVRE